MLTIFYSSIIIEYLYNNKIIKTIMLFKSIKNNLHSIKSTYTKYVLCIINI